MGRRPAGRCSAPAGHCEIRRVHAGARAAPADAGRRPPRRGAADVAAAAAPGETTAIAAAAECAGSRAQVRRAQVRRAPVRPRSGALDFSAPCRELQLAADAVSRSLVIGATGLVGSYLLHHLARSGETPYAMSRSPHTDDEASWIV